jgi:hypothetical protein
MSSRQYSQSGLCGICGKKFPKNHNVRKLQEQMDRHQRLVHGNTQSDDKFVEDCNSRIGDMKDFYRGKKIEWYNGTSHVSKIQGEFFKKLNE